MKRIFKEVFSEIFEFDSITAECGIQIAERRVDLIIKNLRKLKIYVEKESWLRYVYDNRNSWIIIEFKGPYETISFDVILTTIYYKLLLAISEKIWFHAISAFVIGPRLAKNVRQILAEKTHNYLRILGNKAFYEIINDKTLEIHVITYDELDPNIPGNESLCMFSSKEKICSVAIKRILETYDSRSILYSFALFYKPDIVRIKMKEPIPKENIAKAVEVIGLDRLAEALGPKEVGPCFEKGS